MTDVSTDAERRNYLIEIFAAVLLGLATVGAAYGAFQASLYDGNSLDKYSEGISKVAEASGSQLQAAQEYTLDMVTWMEWQSRMISADKEDGDQAKVDNEIAESIENQFMEDRLTEALIWAAEEHKRTKEYVHPTESPAYQEALLQESFDIYEASQEAMEVARKSNGMGDQFTLTTVLYTIVLFFTGIATVFKHDKVKLTLLAMSTLLFLATTVRLFMLPMAS